MATKPRILVIDDEFDIREVERLALTAAGYEVDTAADGKEGLEKYGFGDNWDLVLLDQRMPGMQGVDVLHRIREQNPNACVVMVTAHASIELVAEVMKSGATDFLRKPFDVEILYGTVKAALEHPRHTQTTVFPEPGFHILNGFQFRLAPSQELAEPHSATEAETNTEAEINTEASAVTGTGANTETSAEADQWPIRRLYDVRDPAGEAMFCTVEVTPFVKGLFQEATGYHPDNDPLWNTVCESALANYLWQEARLPPPVLHVSDLTGQQLQVARHLAGFGPPLGHRAEPPVDAKWF